MSRLNGRLDRLEEQAAVTYVPTWPQIADVIMAASDPMTPAELASMDRLCEGIRTEEDDEAWRAWLEANAADYTAALDERYPNWRAHFDAPVYDQWR